MLPRRLNVHKVDDLAEWRPPDLESPVSFHYLRLTEKHLEEQLESAFLVGLAQRRAVIEASGPLSAYSNILLWVGEESSGEVQELYAKVIRPLGESDNRYLIHFTSVAPGTQEWLSRLPRGEEVV